MYVTRKLVFLVSKYIMISCKIIIIGSFSKYCHSSIYYNSIIICVSYLNIYSYVIGFIERLAILADFKYNFGNLIFTI